MKNYFVRFFPRASTVDAGAGGFSVTVLCVVLFASVHLLFSTGAPAQVPGNSAQGANPHLLTNSPPADAALGPVDWVLVIDTSASMSGHEHGFPNIFPLVQETLQRFLPEIRGDDTLTIIVFDTDSRLVSTIPKSLRSTSDREAVAREINKLVARGAWTHTGATRSKDGLSEVYSRSDKNRPAAIILLSDGHEDVRGIQNPIRIPDAIRLIQDENVPYVFYVSLGATPDPQLQQFLAAINQKAAAIDKKRPTHAFSFNDPGAQGLLENAKKIREAVTALRVSPIDINPQSLGLGLIPPGGNGESSGVEFLCPVPATLRLEMLEVPADVKVEGIPDTLTCGPGQWERVHFIARLGRGAG